MSNDDERLSVFSAIFSRKGGSCKATRLWSEWNIETRNAELRKFQLEPLELPVLLSLSDTFERFLLTTRRFAYGSKIALLSEIVDVKPVAFSEEAKDDLTEIDIGMSADRSMRIAIPAGASYFAVWSVFLHIAKRNIREKL